MEIGLSLYIVFVCRGTQMKIRGHLCGVSSLLQPLCGLWGFELRPSSLHSNCFTCRTRCIFLNQRWWPMGNILTGYTLVPWLHGVS